MFARPYTRLCLLPLLVACDIPTGPDLPSGAEPIQPPAIYESWWQLTEACAGRRAEFRDVQWYVVRGVDRLPGHQGVVGAWFPRGNSIVLTEGALLDGTLVRHEMLHSLLGEAGAAHPRDAFIGACGGVVACSGACEAEAGPARLPAAPVRVAPSDLAVDVSVFPSQPARGVFDGHYYMLVTVQHTGTQSVEVELPDLEIAGLKAGADVAIRGDGSTITSWAPARSPESARFSPGETKRYVFDFRVGERNQHGQEIPQGTWTFHGAFGKFWDAQPPVVTIGP